MGEIIVDSPIRLFTFPSSECSKTMRHTYLANLLLLLFLQIRPCPERQTPVRRQQRSRWSLGDRGLHGHHLGVQGDLISLHPPNYSFVMGLRPPPNQTPVIHVSSSLSTFLCRPSPSSTRSTTASSAPTSTTRAPGTTAVATPAAEAEEEEAVVEAPRNPVEADQGGARPRPRRPDCTGKRDGQ